ncbi:MAG: hypothetical protein LQ345_004389 [Seirophora villosa]|nr:MAG: hypothetical protein LQ345_004389 [Seirophora villosa]
MSFTPFGFPKLIVPPQSIGASATAPSALPPSVEAAYKIKCIALKKRMAEIEEHNNGTRERVVRNERAIRKLRLERAILVNRLGEIINKNGVEISGLPVMSDDNSEGSSEGPPTPHEKPLRSKRSHRRPLPSPPPALVPSSTDPTPRTHRHHPYEPAYPTLDPHYPYPTTARHHARPTSGLTNGHPSSSSHPGYHHPAAAAPPPPITTTATATGVRGGINPHEPPTDAFTTWLNESIRQNHHLGGLPEDEQLNKARESWARLPPTEHERMGREYQERLEAWEGAVRARAAAVAAAEAEAMEVDEEEREREREREVERDEGGGEERGKGTFTAVNG